MTGKPPKRRRRPLPPARGATGQRFAIPITEYLVGDFCPTPDGTGPPEAVGIQLMTGTPDLSFMLRLRSPAAVDEFIAAVLRHRNSVWPDAEPYDFNFETDNKSKD